MAALAVAASAEAAIIDGTPLRVYMDGTGRLQARYRDSTLGERVPGNLDAATGSGVLLIVYPPDGAARVCDPSRMQTVRAPSQVAGAGTHLSPFNLSTTFACDGTPLAGAASCTGDERRRPPRSRGGRAAR